MFVYGLLMYIVGREIEVVGFIREGSGNERNDWEVKIIKYFSTLCSIFNLKAIVCRLPRNVHGSGGAGGHRAVRVRTLQSKTAVYKKIYDKKTT